MTFTEKKYSGLIEIVCEAPSALCPGKTNIVAVISHQPGGKWHVSKATLGCSAPFATRRAAEAHVREFIA